MYKYFGLTWLFSNDGVIFLGLLILPFCSFSQEQVLSLKDCLEFGLENSYKVHAAKLENDKLEHQIKEGKSMAFPHVSANSDYRRMLNLPVQQLPGEFFNMPGETIPIRFGTNNIWTSGISLEQVIYNKSLFGMTKLEGDTRLLYGLLIEQAEEEMMFGIAEQYFSILKNEEQKKVLDLNMERLTKLEELVQLQFENDFAKASDVKKVQVKKATLEVYKLQLNAGIAAQYKGLKLQMGMDISEEMTLKPAQPTVTKITSDQLAKENQVLFKLMQQQMRLEERQYQITKDEGLPSLVGKGYLGFQFQENEFQIFDSERWRTTSWLGLSLHAPIFDGFARKAKMQQSQVELEKIKLNYDAAAQFSDFEYETALADVTHKKELLLAQQNMIDLSEELYEQMLLQYKESSAVLLELLNAEADLRQANLTYQQQLFDYQLAVLKLLKTQGRVRELMNLGF